MRNPILFGALAAFALSAGSATAQTTAPGAIPEKIAPDAKPTAPAKNLSRELNQSGGVIHPPKDPDPAMNKGTPATGDPNVIRPPATKGGAEAPQAK